MRFEVSKDVFDLLPDACFGVVAVRGVDNSRSYPEVSELLHAAIAECEGAMAGVKVKESPEIVPYREAFRALGINPNKFMCSIEALMTRIAKGIGAHDMGTVERALEVRHAREGDTFVPFGGGEAETPDENEVVYVSGGQVRTRRWTWRQSEIGKITEATTDLLFPIDGFRSINYDRVLEARKELSELIESIFGAKTAVGMVDRDNPVFECEL